MQLVYSRLLTLAAEGYRIVTPDALHASMLAERYVAARLPGRADNAGRASWERPNIQSIDAWLASCWQEVRYNVADVPVLLSAAQELLLWRQVIAAEGDELLNAEATADLARRAALTVAEWGIPTDAAEWSENTDASRFRDWYQDFRRLCARRGFVTRGDLWATVRQWIANGDYRPGKMAFFGFDAPSPAIRQLLDELGDDALMIDADTSTVSAAVTTCEQFEDEIELAARWARAVFEDRPNHSIGVFIPDLPAHRSSVERTFRRVFYPGSALRFENQQDRGASAFHIAAAAPLENHPLIANALLILELGKAQMTQSDAGAILRCPFLSDARTERHARAKADVLLRRSRELEVTLRELQFAAKDCPSLLRILHAVDQLKEKRGQYEDLPVVERVHGRTPASYGLAWRWSPDGGRGRDRRVLEQGSLGLGDAGNGLGYSVLSERFDTPPALPYGTRYGNRQLGVPDSGAGYQERVRPSVRCCLRGGTLRGDLAAMPPSLFTDPVAVAARGSRAVLVCAERPGRTAAYGFGSLWECSRNGGQLFGTPFAICGTICVRFAA